MKHQDCWNHVGVWGEEQPRCPRLAEFTSCRNCDVFARAGHELLERPPLPEHLEEWAQALAQEKAVDSSPTTCVTAFRLGVEWLALPTACLVEVTEPRVVRPLPHRRGGMLLGLVNVRGEVHLCVSLRDLLHVDASDPEMRVEGRLVHPRLVVAERGSSRWAFPVEEVLGVFRLRSDHVQELPATVARDRHAFTRGLFEAHGHAVGLLDHDMVFRALEQGLGDWKRE